jgi:5-methylcytosine-specific restriction endonuclease McrA
MRISEEQYRNLRTPKGGFTKAQIAYCKELGIRPGQLRSVELTEQQYHNLNSLRPSRAKVKPKIINKVSKPDGWSWQPEKSDIPEIKKTGLKKPSLKQKRIRKAASDDFYESVEWRTLRVRVLEKYECKCMMCGRSPKRHGIVIHVDHIKPISKSPHLCLEFNNLQLLCEDCNLGKGNKYQTDWRPE